MAKLRTREGLLRGAIEAAWPNLLPKEFDPLSFGGWLETRAKDAQPENRQAALQLVKDALSSADALNKQGCKAAIDALKKLGPEMPQDHHYVPKFYLQAWAGDDELLGETKFYRGALRHQRLSPSQTGKVKHLFSIREDGLMVKQQNPAQLEFTLFGPIDRQAALVHQRLLGPGPPLESQERLEWATFLHSIIKRDPRAIRAGEEWVKTVELHFMKQDLATAHDERSRSVWSNVHRPMDHEVRAKNTALLGLRQSLKNEESIRHFTSMRWWKVEAKNLLTSDRPVTLFADDAGVKMATIALSPTMFMLHVADGMDFDADQMVADHNRVIMTTGPHVIYSTQPLTPEQEALAAKHLSPEPPTT